ncbi:MAG: aminopeptidase P family protein [Deltaproteobacteria bacterium]|jgi:Xaa-Pro aminopeptidase|nr:aminopeptidase P family protein [Deltaproteobacteria bacterium]
MDNKIYQERREKLRKLLKEQNLGGMLVTLDANRFYLSGFELLDAQTNESSGCLFITTEGKGWLCTDARYEEAALKLCKAATDFEVFIYSGAGGYATQINRLLKDKLKNALGFEALCISQGFFEEVTAGLSIARADGLVEKLRIIKSPDEIAIMQASCALNHTLLNWLPGVLTYGRTEKNIAWDIEQFFRNHGAGGLAFDSIVGINTNAALPHARASDSSIGENCCVLVDVGCRLDDYCSDQTRTFWVGNKVPEHFLKTLEQVKEAQKQAIAAIKPGVICKAVHAIAYKYFETQGVARHFNHGLGHGVGLQTHEQPRLNARDETVLKPGMVVTVEPGLYYPEWGGVRWEYMVLVTEDGCRIL